MSRHVAWNWLLSRMVSSAKLGKSLSSIALSMSSQRFGTTTSARNFNRSLVFTVVCIPFVDEVSFLWSLT